jgi:CubicO group peptidase (beta-lactamase class C family)
VGRRPTTTQGRLCWDWCGFTAALLKGGAILLSASNIRLLADRKILIWTDLVQYCPGGLVDPTALRHSGVLVSVTVAATGTMGTLQAQVSSVRSARDVISRLESEVPGLMKQGGVPGMSIALIRDGKTVWLRGFGVKDKKTGEPVETDTVFEAASLSKPVFTYGVLKLVDQGKLNLDTPLSSYLPKPYVPDERAGEITARLVLSHRTGFPNWRGSDGLLPIYFSPGERFSYSGEG